MRSAIWISCLTCTVALDASAYFPELQARGRVRERTFLEGHRQNLSAPTSLMEMGDMQVHRLGLHQPSTPAQAPRPDRAASKGANGAGGAAVPPAATGGTTATKATAPSNGEEPKPKAEPEQPKVSVPKQQVGLAGEAHIPEIKSLDQDLTPEQVKKKEEQKKKSDKLHEAIRDEKKEKEETSGVKERDETISAALKPAPVQLKSTSGWANLLTISIAASTLMLFVGLWAHMVHDHDSNDASTQLVTHSSRSQSYYEVMRESVLVFLEAPGQLYLILFVQCLEALKWYSSLAILPLLLSNEYHYSDVQAAVAVGNFTMLSVLFSFGGSVIVDRVGIATYTQWSCFFGFLTRIAMTYWTQDSFFIFCLVVLIPVFESALGAGTKTAIVRLTTNEERDFAFAISYSVINAAGAVGFMFADYAKDSVYHIGHHRLSGLRLVLLLTAFVQLVAWFAGHFMENIEDPRLSEEELNSKNRVSVRHQLRGFITNPDCFRALVFQVCTMFAALQWQLAETLLPKYLTRIYGTEVMWGTVTSINLWACTILPPIFSALLMGFSDFGVIVPGLLIFALSPAAMIIFPNLPGSVMWIIILSIGEVIWSPRSQSYLAALSPIHGQALFLSMVHSPRVAFNFIGTVAGGMLLGAFVPQCSECQDSLGFFCDGVVSPTEQAKIGEASRWSPNMDFSARFAEPANCKSMTTNEYCGIHPDLALQPCPSNCTECPGWSHDGRSMWAVVLAVAMITPVITILLRRRLERQVEAATGEAPCADET